MPRKKIKLAYIMNDTVRRTTLKKRRLSLLKKADELSILCNVPACAVIYSPKETEPEIWPSETGARDLLNRFSGTEGFGKFNNMMNQEKFLCTQTAKLSIQLQRVMAENDELEGEILLREFVAGCWTPGSESYELGLIESAIARRIDAVKARTLVIGNNKVESQPLSLLLPPPPPPPSPPLPPEEMMAGGEDSWTDVALGWELELFPGYEVLFQPDF